MRTRRFGPLPTEVPILGLGTWNMERDRPASAIAAIRRALEHGLTHIDTAEMYGDGQVERLVGEAIAGQRDRVFLVSKVLPGNASYDGTLRACDRSLERLGTDRLDLYLLHWREDRPLADTFRAFEILRERGKIRAWGVSNFDDRDLAEALHIVGPGKIACNQVLYHLGERSIEHRVIPWCERHGVAVVAYSPLGSGAFRATPRLEQLAAQLHATPRQLALAYLVRHAFVIPKSSAPEHVDELAAADRIELDAAAIATLEADYPRPLWRGLPTS
jgi:diketogulonate reductase-like aldo/keto reductase